jgi:putative hydrolase
MKYLVDVHTHTLVSGHAYSTLIENAKCASERGLKIMGSTEHGPALRNGPGLIYFMNFRVIPKVIHGVEILMGVEANILDFKGSLDIPHDILKKMDVVIASLHDIVIDSGNREENTEALLKAMDNKYVDILGHIGNPQYEIDMEAVVKRAKEKNVLIEINNSSLGPSRPGSYGNCLKVAEMAAKIGAKVILGSDAHMCFDVGNFEKANELVEKAGVPHGLIMNLSPEKFKDFLHDKKA